MPLVTIVTITYNLVKMRREKQAKQCLESVRMQSYPFIEHLIIDGASTDSTMDFLQPYAEGGDLVVYSEPDKGIYDAMNKGIAKAKGKYICFLNTDDFFHDIRAVETSVEALECSGAAYSFANARLLYEYGKAVIWKGDITKLLWGSHYCHQTMFVQTDVLRRINGFDLSYKVSADTELMMRLYAENVPYVYIDRCIVSYRVGGFSSQNQIQSRIDHSTAFYRHLGKQVGLSRKDCFLCWNLCLFDELPLEQQLDVIFRVPEKFGLEHLLHEYGQRLWKNGNFTQKKYYLFGFIPVWKCRVGWAKRKSYLFGLIPIMKAHYK